MVPRASAPLMTLSMDFLTAWWLVPKASIPRGQGGNFLTNPVVFSGQGSHKGQPSFQGTGLRLHLLKGACEMGDTVLTIFGKYNLPQPIMWDTIQSFRDF